MENENKQAGWKLNADFCRAMAEQATSPEMRITWLALAQRWLLLSNLTQPKAVESDFADNDGMNQRPLDTTATD